jgi:hypothetical protein
MAEDKTKRAPQDAPETKSDWECGRCFWLLNGRPGEEVPEHSRHCPYRDAGGDPKVSDLEPR